MYSYNKNLVYTAALSEHQIVMCNFGPNIQHIAGVDNTVDDILIIIQSKTKNMIPILEVNNVSRKIYS